MAKNGQKPTRPIIRKPADNAAEGAAVPEETPQVEVADQPVEPEPPVPAAPAPSRRLVTLTSAEEVSISVADGSLADFEALLAGGADAAPKRSRLEVGERVDGVVESIGERWIYIKIANDGREGMAHRHDFTDKAGAVTLAVGQEHPFFVLRTDEGSVLLGDQMSTKEAAMEALEASLESGVPIQGRVVAKNKGGFEVEVGGIRAFCPVSQIELGFCEDPDVHMGKSYTFRVTEIRDARSIVVSRAQLLREEADRLAAQTLATIRVGDVVSGTISRLADFGAFVDLGGVEGLIHVSELGFTRVEHPSELVREGERVTVVVLSMEEGAKGHRIGLSLKQAMEDPWDNAVTTVHEGQKVTGTVTRLEPFGAFVEVAPNVEGLVHVSEMSWEKHVKRPSDVVSVGDRVSVEVQSVDIARRRISLSMKTSDGDPWIDIEQRYTVGTQVTGTVENVEDFGVFVVLGSGITALVPRSELDLPRESTPHAKFAKGDEITARVLSVEPDRRRMALTLKSEEEIASQAGTGPRSYSDSGSSGFGTLGDLLRDKKNR